MLLGQGDFIQCLIESLSQLDMNKPSSTMNHHSILETLQSAIRASNAQFEDQEVIQRLDVRKVSTNDIGWEAFYLDYSIPSPLDIIFTDEAMNIYMNVFRVLWRVKRIEITVNATWKKFMNLSRKIPKQSPVAALVHYCNTTRHSLVYFLNTFQHYLMFDVLETSWLSLLDKIDALKRSAGDLDDLIKLHQTYLKGIEEHTFLKDTQEQLDRVAIITPVDPQQQQQQHYRKWTNKDVKKQIEKMLSLILQFVTV